MSTSQPAWRRIALFILHQWLIIGIGIACLLAYFFPNVAKHGGMIRSEYSILYGAVAIVFLISGLSIPQEKLVQQLSNWRLHILVQVTSFLFIPALVLAVVHLILAGDKAGRIDRGVLVGYIFTACIPTTIASNVVMTRSAGGDDAAALAEVLIANILGPFVTAGWTVTLLPASKEFDVWRDQKEISRPCIVTFSSNWAWPCYCLWLSDNWSTFSSCFATGALQALSTENIIFVVLFNIALYLFLTAILQQMSVEESIAVCFCGPAKSTALGIPLLYAMWTPVDLYMKAKTSVPVLLYTTEQLFVAHFFVHTFRWWKRRIRGRREEGEEDEPPSASFSEGTGKVKGTEVNESRQLGLRGAT